jgi:hypothetical protein
MRISELFVYSSTEMPWQQNIIYMFITACKVVSLITLESYSDCLTPTYAETNAFDFDIAHTRGVNVVL